jgi:hypothetical protein
LPSKTPQMGSEKAHTGSPRLANRCVGRLDPLG